MDGFYEDDESVADVAAAYEVGVPGLTGYVRGSAGRALACRHMTVSGPVTSASCSVVGCEMTPVE
jgi:hypothetical protein